MLEKVFDFCSVPEMSSYLLLRPDFIFFTPDTISRTPLLMLSLRGYWVAFSNSTWDTLPIVTG